MITFTLPRRPFLFFFHNYILFCFVIYLAVVPALRMYPPMSSLFKPLFLHFSPLFLERVWGREEPPQKRAEKFNQKRSQSFIHNTADSRRAKSITGFVCLRLFSFFTIQLLLGFSFPISFDPAEQSKERDETGGRKSADSS